MKKVPVTRIAVIFLAMCAAVGVRLVFVQICVTDTISHSEYTDTGLATAIREAVDKRAIRVENDTIEIDRDQLSSGYRHRIGRLVSNGFICAEDGDVRWNERICRIRNPRSRADRSTVVRGSILDRNGNTLVRTVVADGVQSRLYTSPTLFFHTAGYLHPIFGPRGVERYMNPELTGDRRGFIDGILKPWRVRDEADSVLLTIDKSLQRKVVEAVADYEASAIVIDIRTGGILACVDTPGFDPQSPVREWNDAVDVPVSPLNSAALTQPIEPGSTFKLVVAAAALDAHVVTPYEDFRCTGSFKPMAGARYEIHDYQRRTNPGWPGHARHKNDKWNIADALTDSCNVVFARVGIRLGTERLGLAAERFGFGKNMPLHVKDVVPTDMADSGYLYPATGARLPEKGFTSTHLAATAIGQYEVRATCLQMCLVAAAIANDGVMMTPQLVRRIRAPDGKVRWNMKPEPVARAMSVDTSRYIQRAMRNVVENGTGAKAAVEEIDVAGKTGSAETEGKAHAWFVGFAPADDPEIAIAVVLKHGTSGGRFAAPVAGMIFEAALGTVVE